MSLYERVILSKSTKMCALKDGWRKPDHQFMGASEPALILFNL
jgi:hypothetical protein